MNAKNELLIHAGELGKTILAAQVTIKPNLHISEYDEEADAILYPNLDLPKEARDFARQEFLEAINVNYDNGYGGQELFGTVWFTDGTWSTRGEYDGSEWWEHHSCPPLPEQIVIK